MRVRVGRRMTECEVPLHVLEALAHGHQEEADLSSASEVSTPGSLVTEELWFEEKMGREKKEKKKTKKRTLTLPFSFAVACMCAEVSRGVVSTASPNAGAGCDGIEYGPA